jgi:ABC-type xylose transport system substrate-binding protein
MRFSPRGLLATGFLPAVAFAVLAGLVARPEAVRAEDDPAAKLKAAWEDVLKAAAAGEEAKVKEFLEKTVMKEADFVAIFKDEEKAKEVAARYTEKYAKRWASDAKNFINIVKEKGYDSVRVVEVTANAKDQTGNDKKVLAQLKEGTKMYAVHLVKGSEPKGRRYDSFFYVNDHWVTGLKLAPLLVSSAAPQKEGE